MRKTQVLALIVCLTSLTVWGCGGGGVQDHLKRGDQYLADHKLAEAVVEYEAAVKADSKSGPARQKLGEAYDQAKDYARAAKELMIAADLLPNDLAAQLRAGRALLVVGQFEDARGRADKVLAVEPRNADAHILRGNALAGLQDLKGALDEVQTAVEADPNKTLGYSELGVFHFAKGDRPAAEAAFKRAVAADPKSVQAKLSLGNFYWSTGRLEEAEAVIKDAVTLDPANTLANRALAILYLGSGRLAQAEAPLKVVAEHSNEYAAKIFLADYYMRQRRLPEAKALYEQVVATSPEGTPAAKLRLASLGLLSQDRPEAYRLINEIIAKNAKQVEALTARAQLEFSDGKMTEALADARSAVAAGPESPLAHYVLGNILKSQYQLEEAEAAFKDSVRTSQGFAPANVELAKLALDAGRYDDAGRYAQAAIDRAPAYAEAYLVLARAQIATGKGTAAEQPLRQIAAKFPDSPGVQAELGRLLLSKSDLTGAAAAYSKALAKEPLQVVALEGMVAVEVQQKRLAAARARLDAAVKAAPKNSDLQLMAARLYKISFTDAAASEAAVRRAIDADPNNLPAFEFLADLYVQQNNLAAATAEFEKLAQRQPKSVTMQTSVGLLYHLQNKLDQAKAAYERALALDPRAPIAANNLAQLYLDKNENFDVALQLAQTAKAGLPKAHQIDDTLGWAQYRKGNGLMAVSSLKAAVAAQPENAVYLYHLGAAYALAKDKSNARQSLEKALKMQPGFPGSDDARKILDSLK